MGFDFEVEAEMYRTRKLEAKNFKEAERMAFLEHVMLEHLAYRKFIGIE